MSFNYVLLLARQRSGTSALGSILDKSADAYYLGEPFNLKNFGKPRSFFSFKERAVLEEPALIRPDNNQKLWDIFIEEMNAKFEGKAFVDVKYNQTHHLNGEAYLPTNPPWLLAHAFGRKMPIIHLTRRNHLKNFVSVLKAKKSGVWHTKTKNDALDLLVKVNTDDLMKHIRLCENTLALFNSWMEKRRHVFTIDYSETFNADGSLSPKAVEGIQRITGFSGLEDLSADFLKQTSDNLANEIENFADVTEALSPTKHAWMLTD